MEELEKKEYYEVNLPPYLQHDLDAMKEGKYPYDCLWCELYGSINSAYVDGSHIRRPCMVFKRNVLRNGKGVKHLCSLHQKSVPKVT